MTDITRREFIRRSIIIAAGATLIPSCEDNEGSPNEDSPPSTYSPGMLSGNRPYYLKSYNHWEQVFLVWLLHMN